MLGLRRTAVNVSSFSDADTACTRFECAVQRSENLAVLGVKRVIELCVGPSLRALERAYALHGISVVGNDIDDRWRRAHPRGAWVIGDALSVPLGGFDAAVFAPPLSRGCSGEREDALMIEEVRPSYGDFMRASNEFTGLRVLVLPARSGATREDRRQLHALLARLPPHEVVQLTAGRRRIVKYHDVIVRPFVDAEAER